MCLWTGDIRKCDSQCFNMFLVCMPQFLQSRKELDPEEEPDFTERHPLWEDELPPIYPNEDHVPDFLTLEETSPKVPIAPTVLSQEESHISESAVRARQRWKSAYATIKKNLVSNL